MTIAIDLARRAGVRCSAPLRVPAAPAQSALLAAGLLRLRRGRLRRVPVAALATASTRLLELHPPTVADTGNYRDFSVQAAAARRRSDLASGSPNRRWVALNQAAAKARDSSGGPRMRHPFPAREGVAADRCCAPGTRRPTSDPPRSRPTAKASIVTISVAAIGRGRFSSQRISSSSFVAQAHPECASNG